MTKSLDVYLQDTKVGSISLLPGNTTYFAFDEEYVHNENRPTLSQGFLSTTSMLIPQAKIQTRLHPFFSNLLPEGPLRDYLALKNQLKTSQEFELIQALGEDLPGAVRICPSDTLPLPLEDLPTSLPEIGEAAQPYRFSLAGVQLKFSALLQKKGGLTIPTSGIGGTWIIKLPSATFFQVPENEYAMMTLAKQVGINVPDVSLIPLTHIEGLPPLGPFQSQMALAVKRFDRGEDHTRIHMEDFAQAYALYPEQKYEKVSHENIANMIWIVCGEQGLVEYVRRLVFCILIGNGDMHLKNWSLLYPNGRTPQLSPAYDLLSTMPYIAGETLSLSLMKNRQMDRCTPALFMALAKKAQVPQHLVMQTVVETSEKTRGNWAYRKRDLPLDAALALRIESHMASIPL